MSIQKKRTKKIKRISVKSSNIASVGFDIQKKVLEVEFYSGGTYQYSNVPKEVYFRFIKSESLGKFLHTSIKGVYSYKKV